MDRRGLVGYEANGTSADGHLGQQERVEPMDLF